MSAYTPSDDVQAAVKAVEEAQQALNARKKELRAAVAADLKAQPDVTNDQAAEVLPYSAETIRGIAREYDIPRKRKPTVRSIKPQRRTTGKS